MCKINMQRTITRWRIHNTVKIIHTKFYNKSVICFWRIILLQTLENVPDILATISSSRFLKSVICFLRILWSNKFKRSYKWYQCWSWKVTMYVSILRALGSLEIKNKNQTKNLGSFFCLAQCFPNKPNLS